MKSLVHPNLTSSMATHSEYSKHSTNETSASWDSILQKITEQGKSEFAEKKFVISFSEYLEIFFQNPLLHSRHAAKYIKDMIDFYGFEEIDQGFGNKARKYNIFERERAHNRAAIVGQSDAHEQIYRILEQFVRIGKTDKLILLHGPNGSSKSSTADAIACALEEWSRLDEGISYKFSWIFPNDKVGFEGLSETQKGKNIGFGAANSHTNNRKSFAHLAEDEILCKISSELRENPIFLFPKRERIEFFRAAMQKNGLPPDQIEVPCYLEEGALSAKNKAIFDALLNAYQGDLDKVFRHVQVERNFFSSRYRTGIATVEPQMTVDAQERQLTMDRNIQNIPPVLQSIRLFETSGDLVDANRGLIEYADLLKRPLEAFKYLLNTIEKMSINLTSGYADLDLVMIGSTNEKHLDAFKASPDWPSFKGRFELIRVPYLLSSKTEAKIYEQDVKIIEKTKPFGPHAIKILATWSVLTRLRQPDPEAFDFNVRSLISKLTPYDKLAIYDGKDPVSPFNETEKATLKKLYKELRKESQSSVAYEGRFGASPREMKTLLFFASQHHSRDQVSALAVIEEIEKLIRDRSVYDYLQFESRNGYHDCTEFLNYIKHMYAGIFHKEFLTALNLFDEEQYQKAFDNYLKQIVAFLKNERVQNELTGKLEEPNETVMTEIESLTGQTGEKKEIRERFMARIASWKVDHPTEILETGRVFQKEIETISRKIYEDKQDYIEKIRTALLTLDTDDYEKLPEAQKTSCEAVLKTLQGKFGYSRKNSWESLVFLRSFN